MAWHISPVKGNWRESLSSDLQLKMPRFINVGGKNYPIEFQGLKPGPSGTTTADFLLMERPAPLPTLDQRMKKSLENIVGRHVYDIAASCAKHKGLPFKIKDMTLVLKPKPLGPVLKPHGAMLTFELKF